MRSLQEAETAAAVAMQAKWRGYRERARSARLLSLSSSSSSPSPCCLGVPLPGKATALADAALTAASAALPCLASLSFHPRARALALATAREREERGHVTVTLLSAEGLKAADRGGTSDPYAVLDLAASKRWSSVVKKSLAPEWDETFSWNGVLFDLLQDGLVVSLFDRDKASRDDCLGMALVPLDELLERREACFTAPLSLQGSVKLRIRWRSAAAEWAEAREAALAAARPLPVPVPPSSLSSRGVVSVRLFSAQELRGADADGLSDPYAEVRLGSRGAVRSSICSRTRDPVWDETFSFGGEVAQLLAEPLAISLYDKDASRLDRDDSLGKATLDLSPLRTQYAAALTGTVLYKRSQPRGQVHAVVSWVSGEEPSGDQAGQQQAGQQQPPSSGRAAQPPPGLQGLRLPAVKLPPRPARLSLGRVGRRQAASIRGQHGASPDGSAYSPSGGSDLAV